MKERSERWIVKSMRFHGSNVVSCEIVFGAHQTSLIRAHLNLYIIYHLPYLEEALNHFPGREPIVMEYLNEYTGSLQNPWNEYMADFLVSFRLVDLLGHFRQQVCFHHIQMQWKVQQVKLIGELGRGYWSDHCCRRPWG